MFNRILKLGALPLIVLFAAACSDNGMTGPESETQTATFSVTDVPAGETTSETLYAAQDNPVGTVTVTHEGGGQVSITYDVDSGVCLTETHWEATYGSSGSLTNNGGNPQIGQFAYGDDTLDCVSSYTEGPVDITGDDDGDYIVAAHAVVNLGGASVNPQVVHGTFDADGDGAEEGDIYGINPSTGDLTLVADIPNDDSGDPFDPNGLALDRATEELFFVESGDLYKVPAENADPTSVTPTLVQSSLGGGGPIRNATIAGDYYYYIPNGTEALWSVPTDGSAGAANVCDLDTPATDGLFFGDIAADPNDQGVFHGVARMNSGSDGEVIFFTVDTSDCTSPVVRDEEDLDYDFQLQVAFGDDGTLYGQQAISEPEGINPGQWYILDPATGLITSTLETTDRSFTDIAGGLPFEVEGEEETAWADGERFTERGNWATWMGPFSIDIE